MANCRVSQYLRSQLKANRFDLRKRPQLDPLMISSRKSGGEVEGRRRRPGKGRAARSSRLLFGFTNTTNGQNRGTKSLQRPNLYTLSTCTNKICIRADHRPFDRLPSPLDRLNDSGSRPLPPPPTRFKNNRQIVKPV